MKTIAFIMALFAMSAVAMADEAKYGSQAWWETHVSDHSSSNG